MQLQSVMTASMSAMAAEMVVAMTTEVMASMAAIVMAAAEMVAVMRPVIVVIDPWRMVVIHGWRAEINGRRAIVITGRADADTEPYIVMGVGGAYASQTQRHYYQHQTNCFHDESPHLSNLHPRRDR
jgi:hypothetical protein